MFGVGIAAAAAPPKAQAQPLLCEFQLSSYGDGSECQGLCEEFYPGYTYLICNQLNGCCNCYY